MSKTLNEILDRHKLRKTDLRREVLGIFLDARNEALSQSDIEENLIDVDRISLYRTIKSFENKGIIHHAVDGGKVAKYAYCQDDCSEHAHEDNHAHFHCTNCGLTECLDERNFVNITVPENYFIESIDIVVNGICADCAE